MTVLFTVERADGSTFNVEAWAEYGVVAPAEITSNGSAAMVAKHLHARAARGDYLLPPEWRLPTAADLQAALVSAHYATRKDSPR